MIRRVTANHGRGKVEDFELSCDVDGCDATLRVCADRVQDAWYAAVDEGWANRTIDVDEPGRSNPVSADLCPHDAGWADLGRGVPLAKALS